MSQGPQSEVSGQPPATQGSYGGYAGYQPHVYENPSLEIGHSVTQIQHENGGTTATVLPSGMQGYPQIPQAMKIPQQYMYPPQQFYVPRQYFAPDPRPRPSYNPQQVMRPQMPPQQVLPQATEEANATSRPPSIPPKTVPPKSVTPTTQAEPTHVSSENPDIGQQFARMVSHRVMAGSSSGSSVNRGQSEAATTTTHSAGSYASVYVPSSPPAAPVKEVSPVPAPKEVTPSPQPASKKPTPGVVVEEAPKPAAEPSPAPESVKQTPEPVAAAEEPAAPPAAASPAIEEPEKPALLTKAELFAESENKIREYFTAAENVEAVTKNQIYRRALVQIIRDAIKNFNTVSCPISEPELKRIGIDRSTMPAIPPVSMKISRNYYNYWVNNFFDEFCGVLNKLTPSNYAKMSNKELIAKRVLNDPGNLSVFVNLVFEKAIETPDICSDLCLAIYNADRSDKRFYNAIIEKCRNVFIVGQEDITESLDKFAIDHFISTLYAKNFYSYEVLDERCLNFLMKGGKEITAPLKIDTKAIWGDDKNIPAFVNLIFEKAVDDPAFVVVYAEVCMAIHMAELKQQNTRYFYYTLVNKLQTVFEECTTGRVDTLKERFSREFQLTPLMLNTFLERMVPLLKRFIISTIRFMSELYRIKFLDNKAVNPCCLTLLQKCNPRDKNGKEVPLHAHHVNEQMIEFSVVLIESIGPYHSTHPAPEQLVINQFVEYLKPFKAVTCNRVRRLIWDLEVLVSKNFVKKNAGPKTKEEVKHV